jgi:glycosyltransferase involved in cell wall biosynthesis
MDKKPLVSVVTIFLNTEKYIEEAIESIFAQTYDNWELLLVDDGSSDCSTEIALRYVQQYPEKVRYLAHEGHQNRGMSASRNLGIRHAKGDLIAFLDSDDVWLPQKFERQVEILNSQPEAAMVCGASEVWYSWTGNPEDAQHDWLHTLGSGVKPDELYQPPTLLTLFLRHQARTPGTCSVLIRREVFEKVGEFEESFRGMYEDRAFFSKVYLNVPVFVTSGYWDRYRRHPDSSCSIANQQASFWKSEPAYLTFLNWMADYLSKEKIKDIQLWWGIQRNLWIYGNPVLFFLHRIKQELQSQFKKMSTKQVNSSL